MNISDNEHEPPSGFLNKPLTRRQLIQGAAVIGAGAALGPMLAAAGSTGAASASPPAAGAAAPKTGGNLRVAIQAGSAKETLDVHPASMTTPAVAAQLNIYDCLLEFGPTGALAMALAQEVVPNRGATQFTVRLKPDLVFHNGKSVTADDVIYSFNRIMNPKNPGAAATELLGLKYGGYKKVDKLTVRFELDSANAIFSQGLAAYNAGIVPVGYNPKGAKGAVGTGPFKIETFIPGEEIVLVKNPNYWRKGGGPYLDTVSLIEFADATSQLNALLGKSADYCNGIPPTQAKIAESSGFELLTVKTGGFVPFTMRADIKPFNDVRVRQAFRLIVNRPQMIEESRDGMGAIGNDMYGLYDPGYPKNLPQRKQDLDQAKSLLKAAGYDNDLRVTLITSTGVTNTAPSDATVFAQQAKGAGVTVKVSNVTSDVFWGAQYLHWVFSQDQWATRDYLAQAAFGTMPGAVYNECHWTNAKWLALVKEAFKTVDDAKRNELVTEACTIEYNEGGYVIHTFDEQLDAHSNKVMGAVPDVLNYCECACNGNYRTMYYA